MERRVDAALFPNEVCSAKLANLNNLSKLFAVFISSSIRKVSPFPHKIFLCRCKMLYKSEVGDMDTIIPRLRIPNGILPRDIV